MNQKIKLDGKTIGILQQDTVGYFNSDTPDSPFSNFYKTAKPFNLYFANGQLGYKPMQGAQKLPFSCVEQVFAYGKAVTMGDKESAKKIINAQSNKPSTYKYLGRAVKNFDATKWKIAAPKWMKLGMLAKFSQDDFAKRALDKVKNYKLGECNPYDSTWGLGMKINNNFALAMGQNKQGKILMQVAQELDQQGIFGKEKQNEKQNTKAKTEKAKKPQYSISLTGHRPNKFASFVKNDNAYDLNDPYYQNMQQKLEALIEKRIKQFPNGIECHSGMALGADQVWAKAIIAEKEKHPSKIKFVADIPLKTQANKWPKKSQIVWQDMLNQADEINVADNGPYKPSIMEKRNQMMISRSNECIAVYNGDKSGGTANGVRDAEKFGCQITRLNPADLSWSLFAKGNVDINKKSRNLIKPAETIKDGKINLNEKQDNASASNTFTANNDLTFADSFDSKQHQSQQNQVSNQSNNRKTLTPINIDAVDPSLAQNNKEAEQKIQNNVTFF